MPARLDRREARNAMETPASRSCDEIELKLTPWADGEAPDPDRAAVDAHLSRCSTCQAQAKAEETVRAVVRARRASLAQSAPAGLRVRCRPQASGVSMVRRWVPLSLAATLVLAIGGAFLYSLNNRVNALAASITADHVKCFKLADTNQAPDVATEAARWEQRHGWHLAVMPGVPADDIRFVGVRRCLSSGGQVAHLMYTSQGRPLSVFVWRKAEYGERELEIFGHRTLLWSSADRMYAVVGTETPERMARVAAYVRQIKE